MGYRRNFFCNRLSPSGGFSTRCRWDKRAHLWPFIMPYIFYCSLSAKACGANFAYASSLLRRVSFKTPVPTFSFCRIPPTLDEEDFLSFSLSFLVGFGLLFIHL